MIIAASLIPGTNPNSSAIVAPDATSRSLVDPFLEIGVDGVVDAADKVANPSKGLYKGSDGSFYIAVNGLAGGDALGNDAISLTAKGKAWTAGKAVAVAVRVTADGYEVLLQSGMDAKASYAVQAFDATGAAVAKASKLTNVGMLAAENSFDQDINKDGSKGDVILNVADAENKSNGSTIGLYALTSGRFVIDVNGRAASAATSSDVVFLTSKGKSWAPGKGTPLAVRTTAGNEFEVLLKTGDGAKAKYQIQAFTETGEMSGKAQSLDAIGLIDAELTFNQEFSGDTTLGDYVVKVLDPQDASGAGGLYAMASGATAIGGDSLATGATASSNDLVRLTDKGKVWRSGKATAIAVAVLGDADSPTGASVVLKSGVGSKAKFAEASFDSTGALSIKPASLKSGAVLEKELAYDQDFNEDGKVGNSAFSIKVNFTGDAKYKPYFDTAAARWSQVILNDLPDATNQSYDWTNVSGYESLGAKSYGVIDDLLLEAVMYDGGNNGNLGSAGPVTQRGDGMPVIGRMRFNTFYMADMISNKTFGDVILHEMGHVLGLGTRWSALKNEAGDYKGSAAVQQYTLLTGQQQTSVPIEKGGGGGTAGAHWAEDIFGDELMTGWAANAPPMPLSRVTVGSLEDLGYTVSYAMADKFSIGSAMAGVSSGDASSAGSMHQMACRCMTCEIKQMADGTIGVELNVSTIVVNA